MRIIELGCIVAQDTTFVWDRAVMYSYVTVSDRFDEICEDRSKIIGDEYVKLMFGSKPFSVRVKHTPNFNENVVAFW